MFDVFLRPGFQILRRVKFEVSVRFQSDLGQVWAKFGPGEDSGLKLTAQKDESGRAHEKRPV